MLGAMTNEKNTILPEYTNSLVVGATGMLQEATVWVAERSEKLVLISRNAPESHLAARSNVVALSADWTNAHAFTKTIAGAGGFTDTQLAVLWMHGNGVLAKRQVLGELTKLDCLIVHVQGSTALANLRGVVANASASGSNATSITVTLGAIGTDAGQRWLTWAEISAGVIEAIEAKESRIVGGLP